MTVGWVLWGLLILVQVVYGAVAFHVAQSHEPKTPPTVFLISLAVASALVAAAAFGLARKLPAYLLRRGTLSGENTGHQVIIVVIQAIGWALATSIAIYGLVLFFLTFDLSYQAPFSITALVLFVVIKPKDFLKERQREDSE